MSHGGQDQPEDPPPGEHVDVFFNDISWKMVIPSSDHTGSVIEKIAAPYEADLLRYACSLLCSGDVVIDVGAHIGNHAIGLALAADVRIMAVESNPVALAYLRYNVALNGLGDYIHVISATPDAKEPNTYAALSRERAHTVTLDSLMCECRWSRKLQLLKIDVASSEAVLLGAQDLISRDRPWILVQAPDEASLPAIHRTLSPFGYDSTFESVALIPTYSWVPQRALAHH
jgi:FkbM family methyltransferase